MKRKEDMSSNRMKDEDEDEDFKPRKSLPKRKSKPKTYIDDAPRDSSVSSNTSNSKSKQVVDPHPNRKPKASPSPGKICQEYCPICQVPLSLLKISAAMHTSNCCVSDNIQACPEGRSCLNTNIFHYRDFSHNILAAFRDSHDYVEPDITFTPKSTKKRTPMKTSKKRPSVSPGGPSFKQPRMEEPSTSMNSTLVSPKGCVVNDKKKRLSFQNGIDESDPDDPNSISDPSRLSESYPLKDPQFHESDVWCSDLTLSENYPQELEEENGTAAFEQVMRENACAPSSVSLGKSISSADIKVEYIKEQDENCIGQSIIPSKVDCSDSCSQFSEAQDSFQANCSVLFRAEGMNREEAMCRSPVSVTLMLNNTGWEAVQIKSTTSTFVQSLQIQLCKCGHTVGLKCSIHNSELSQDVKWDTEQHEKFFATMAGMGLKSQPPPFKDSPSQSKELLKHCNLLTVSSAIAKRSGESEEPEVQEDEVGQAGETGSAEMSAFSVMKKSSAAIFSKKVAQSSNSTSRSSTPTPVPMIVSKRTGSSWTLVAAKENGVTSKSAQSSGWSENMSDQSSSWGQSTSGQPSGWSQLSANKKVPSYKRIPDTPFVVDAFSYGIIPDVKAYFLSHFHSDHYIGLRKNFNMPIFCSQATANLVHLKLRVDKKYLHVLKIGEPRVVQGVEIEVFDAHHCPGAIMFIFRLPDGRVFLHVGDFRAHKRMEEISQLKHVDKLYLDTTYCDPSYDFPPQEEVVSKVVQTVEEHLNRNQATLICCGTYTIGKEKVFMGIAQAFNLKVWTTGEKRRILHCLEDSDILRHLTTDPSLAQVHVLNMKDISFEELSKILNKYSQRYTHIVGFKPTGWTTSKDSIKGKASDFQKSSRGKITIYGVPYSEHSSFSELRSFVRFVRPKDIQVTVNLNRAAQYKRLFQQWLSTSCNGDNQSKMTRFVTNSSIHHH